MLVSTIIPVFNRPLALRTAVASVIAQSHRPIEILIVDDGSTDATPQVADELAGANPGVIRIIGQANAGAGAAREAGRREARGEFLQYLDSDDVLLPGKFETQVNALRSRGDCGIAYGFTRLRRGDALPDPRPWLGTGITRETMFPTFLADRWWGTLTPLYRRSIADEIGPWSNLRLHEDWEYDCRWAAAGVRLVHCRQFVAEVRAHRHGRVSEGSARDPWRLRERTRAYEMVFAHAVRAGICETDVNRIAFAGHTATLLRQAAVAGEVDTARRLLALLAAAMGPQRADRALRSWRFALEHWGTRTAGRCAELLFPWKHLSMNAARGILRRLGMRF